MKRCHGTNTGCDQDIGCIIHPINLRGRSKNMSATIKDIARELGITHSSVSRALNGKQGVSPALRRKILDTARQMGYTPNAMARSLVTRQSMTIAFIVPDFSNPFFVEIAHAVNSTASARGFTTIMCDNQWNHEEELKQIRLMAEKRVDGIIIKSFGEDDSYLVDLGIPVVKLNPATRPELSSIDVDNVLGAYLATEHLIQCGYQHIAFIGSHTDAKTFADRFKGYTKALARHARPVDDRLVCQGEYTHESGARCYENLLATRAPFDAALCENDMIALGVYDRAMRDNRRIPEEFGLVGYDDMFFAGLPMTQLTTMAQPKQKIGIKAANLLLDLIADPEKTRHRSIVYKPELIIRKTTRLL